MTAIDGGSGDDGPMNGDRADRAGATFYVDLVTPTPNGRAIGTADDA